MLLHLILPALALRPPVLPGEPAPTSVSSPDDVHLSFHAGLQWRLGATPRAVEFRERWGVGWIRFDERNGTPRFLGLGGIPEAETTALVADIAALAGIDAAELSIAETTKHPTDSGDRQLVRFARHHHGAIVERDEILLILTNGRIGGARVRLTPLGSLGPALPGERIVPLPNGRAVLAFRIESPIQVAYIDRLGNTLWAYDPRHFSDLTVEYEPITVGDALMVGPARNVTMTDASGLVEVTAADGTHTLSGTLDAWLDGPSLAVYDVGAPVHTPGSDSFTITHDEVSPAAADVLHNFYTVWDWLGARWPTHDWLDDRVPAFVRVDGVCNAYYTGGTISFYAESDVCEDLGRIADVIYHEVGHGVHDYILAGGTFASDVSEGSADFVASTILDNTVIGNGAVGPGSYFREIDTDKFYPADTTGEVHNDGLIWASFLWNLREQWRATYGDDVGIPMVDVLFLGALEQGPTLTDLHTAVMLADDDDGDYTNGTPHDCELQALLNYHGLGPGAIGEILFEHTPLGWQSSATPGYPVSFNLYSLTPDCSGLDEDSVTIWYTTDDSLLLPGTVIPPELPPRDTGTPDDSADTGAPPVDSGDTGGPPEPEIVGYDGWFQVTVSHTGVAYDGVIPRQAATSHVRYFMEATSTDGTEVVQTHAGEEQGLYDFWVGDRHAVWCEGFESGFGDFTHGPGLPWLPDDEGRYLDEWVTGAPVGGDWDPDVPAEGLNIAATGLGTDYVANNAEYLSSPVLDLSLAGPMLLFHQSRWLTVEDATYDHANLYANDLLLFSNAASRGGSTALLDTAWVSQDIALSAVADPSAVTFHWTLTTDQGLEFGGWALDDVCVYDLDDPPGHYRSENLDATDDQSEIVVTWENPWITPLGHVQLVRSATGFPETPTDGQILLDDVAPGIGASQTYIDADVLPGQTWYYALFAAAEGEDWQGGVIEGENADMGSTPADEPADSDSAVDSADSEDTGVRSDTSKDLVAEKSCGCGTGAGGPGWLGLVIGLVWGGRRRLKPPSKPPHPPNPRP